MAGVLKNRLLKNWLLNKKIIRAIALSIPVVSAQLAMDIVLPVQAEAAKKQEETRKTPALRNKVYEKLSEAQKLVEEENYDGALEKLDALRYRSGKKALNSYELANVYNLYAYIYYAREQIDKALQAYRNVVAQKDIPLALEVNTRYTVAQLLMMQERWKEGVQELNVWFEYTKAPSASAFVLRSQAYYQLKNYDSALRDIETAISMYRKKGKVPKEQWLSLARFLHYEKGHYNKVVDLLEELVKLYPKKEYWVQLSHMYGEINNEKKQLSAMETAYVQGFLSKESELVNLAYLYLNHDVPYKAAVVLEKGIKAKQIKATSKNMETLAGSWRKAQELDKAIPAMRQAASKSDKGELWTQLGNIYVDQEKYSDAIKAITAGLNKGGVKRPDSARLSLGMSYFNTKQYDKARKAFNKAGKDKRSKKFASQWLKYMANEIAREKSLAEG